MPAEAYLRLASVVKSYDGATNAVDDVSLDIARGEFITLLGPSGSGKTTTLMMVAGFEAPNSGSILLDGRDLVALKPWQRNIGMVFQSYALFPHMTIEKNVAFPLRMRGIAGDELRRRVADVLALVGLTAFSQRHPRELSGGQQQRVALARGLVFRPDVLLLDEPLGALDKNLREQMQVEIKRIHRDVGITMIYVTHDQTEAMTMSDRIAVFNAGRIEQVAAPLDVYHRPATRFVGEFIGDSNFLSGIVASQDPLCADVEGLGRVALSGEQRFATGAAIDILLRPERVRAGDLAGADTTATMAVETLINYGESILAIGTVSGRIFRVRIAGQAPVALREGASIPVGWRIADMHAIATKGL
ncbi:MAG: ABC transporter ATP-binding protein [Burkholderiales bacterium]